VTEPYTIRTEVFEGPLDVLLSLIERRRLLINDVALAEVSQDYLRYLEQHQDFPVAETAQFILVGSTLVLIKSKSLLPVLSLTSEEESSIADLEDRLKKLDLFKTRGRDLAGTWNTQPLFRRSRVRRHEVTFSPLAGVDVRGLHTAIRSVLKSLPVEKRKLTETTVQKVVSLDEMIDRLTERINSSMQLSFRQFSDDTPAGKVNTIVSFLAMLELVRQGVIRVEQETQHGDIRMHADQVSTPHYA